MNSSEFWEIIALAMHRKDKFHSASPCEMRALMCQMLGCAACILTNPCTKSIALIHVPIYMSMISKCIHLHYKSMHMPSRIIALMVKGRHVE